MTPVLVGRDLHKSFGPTPALRGADIALTAAERWLRRLGLDGLGGRLPGELSGGQGQRVALARALVTDPKVVFADEPTGALDSVATDQVMELFVDAAREQGTGVMLVTHEARVAAYADRTVMVRDGVDAMRAPDLAFGVA
jgi:putative ABC transport system ATP-binding protein